MNRPTDAQLRAFAQITSEEMDRRIALQAEHEAAQHAQVVERLDQMQAALDEMRERVAEQNRVLGIEQRDLPNIAYDALASGDQGAVWDDFEFDQSLSYPMIRALTDGYGRR